VPIAELAARFTFHPAREDQAERYQAIRAEVHAAATVIAELCPESREKSLALTKLDEAVMWANASIARREVVAPAEAVELSRRVAGGDPAAWRSQG
jgi:hypothetical protein